MPRINLEYGNKENFMTLEETKKRMLSGKVYYPSGDDLMAEQSEALEKLYDYNATRPSEKEKREELLREMFAEIGSGCYIEPPLHANWGGRHTYFGNNVYANFNLTLVDDANIYVGDGTMFAPNVVVSTAAHPIDPTLRAGAYQFNLDVHIGKNVWIGAGALIMPGVTIGDNSVIGAGSVVTRDIPANVVAFGTPCRVVREIGEHDKIYYHGDKKIDYENL